jgi:putative flippase GtrA
MDFAEKPLNIFERMSFFIILNFGKFMMFCFVGLTAALIHLTVFNFFRFWVGVSFFISLVLAIFISIIYNFSMNRNITFSARGHSIKKQLPRYLVVYVLSIGTNIITALIINAILGAGVFQENMAAVGGILLSIPISFLGSLFWAFKKD